MPQTQKGFYRLTKGSHSQGFGQENRIYHHDDPHNNIVESEEDLSLSLPEKFVKHEGPPPRQSSGARLASGKPVARGEIKPPPPPTEGDYDMITDLRPMSADDRRKRAESLRKRAQELEESADQQEADSEESTNEARSHVREKFAASDAAQQFEEAGEEALDRAEEQEQQVAQRPQPKQPSRTMSRPQPKQAQQAEETASEVEPSEPSSQDEEQASEGEDQQDDGLDGMNVVQLRSVANKERIGIRNARTKDDLVSQIRQNRQQRAGQ